MKRLIGSPMLGIALVTAAGGCDLTSAGNMDELSKAIISGRSDSADALMTQLQTQDQLKDGTGDNRPMARQAENGQGQGDLLRLRDGSGQ